MTVNETKHAYIDLTTEEVNEIRNVSTFLERLSSTVDELERKNVEWDIRCDIDESEFFDILAEIDSFTRTFV